MKKSDLRTGMRVTTRDGRKYIVLLDIKHKYDGSKNVLVEVGKRSWHNLDNFSDDLTANYNGDTIVKVEVPTHVYAIMSDQSRPFEVICERKEPKEMTLVEIESKLGYPVKIISE